MTKPRDLANLVNPGSITGGQLAAGSVTSAKLATGAVTGTGLASGAVTNAKVANDADIAASKATSLAPFTGADIRDLQDKLGDLVTVKDFGAVGDGVNDDRFALNECQAAVPYVLFPAGTYYLGGFYTFTKPVIFMPGARIKWGNADIVTFTSSLDAGVYRIFEISGTAKVAFAGSNQPALSEGYVEWWGAVPNDPAAAATNLAAISAAVKSLPVTKFQAAAYYINNTLEITDGLRTLQGYRQSEFNSDTGSQTRLVITSASADAIKVYTPGVVPFPQWNQRVTINDMQISRSTAPFIPASGSEISGPAGIRIQQFIWVFINRVTVQDHFSGVLCDGTIRVTMNQVISQRISAGAGPNAATNDKTLHFWLNGYASFGLAGGNASTYFTDCTAGGFPPGKPNDTIGLYMPGAFVDTFVQRFECTQMGWGIYMDGAGLSGPQLQSGCADVHIVTPILDATTRGGIGIFNTSNWTAIDILGGYWASTPAGLPNSAGIRIENAQGFTSITNYQSICWPNATARGLYITNSKGIRAVGGVTHGSQKPIELVATSRSSIEEGIRGHTGYATSQAAVLLSSCSRNYIRPIIYGDANTITIGVSLGGAVNNLNEVNCTNIDSSAIVGGISNVLRIDGTSVTTPGPVNTGAGRDNLASGLIG